MRTKRCILLAFSLFLAISNLSAQGFLDKVLKGVEKTNQILDETDKMLGGSGNSSGNSSSRGGRVTGFKIVSPHPDIKVQFARCIISGSTAVVDLVITNYGNDQQVQLGGSSYTTAFDDAGNQYSNTEVSIAGGEFRDWSYAFLPTDVPIKFRVQIDGVSSKASIFKRLNINIYSKILNLKEPIMLYNVPISSLDDTAEIIPSSTEGTASPQSEMGNLDTEKTNEDFISFEKRFVSDSTFQMQRIMFNDLGYKGSDDPEAESEKFTPQNWSLSKTTFADVQKLGQYKTKQDLTSDKCIHRIWIEDSEFTLEYTYTKINGKWYLTHVFERF